MKKLRNIVFWRALFISVILEAEGQTESSLKIVTTSPTTQTTRATTALVDTRGEWATLNGTEYYVSKRGVSKNNTDAEEYCNQQGGTLALVKTQKIQEFIASLVKDETGLPYMFFIGLHDRFKNGSFYWNEDEPLQSGFWSSGEPNKKHKEEYCVGMGWMYTYEEKLLWRDVVCYVGAAGPKGFVCQRSTVIPGIDTRGEWAALDGIEYYVSRRRVSKNNTDAEKYCNKQGGSLALVKTQRIQEFIASLVKSSTGLPYMFFIGLHDRFKNGSFYWNNDEPLQSGFWSSSEPNNKHKEYCVGMGRMYTYEEKLLWRDVVCYVGTAGPKGFVCQRSTVNRPNTTTANQTTSFTMQTSTSSPGIVVTVVPIVAGSVSLLLLSLGVYYWRHSKRNEEKRISKFHPKIHDSEEISGKGDESADKMDGVSKPTALNLNNAVASSGNENVRPQTSENSEQGYVPMASLTAQLTKEDRMGGKNTDRPHTYENVQPQNVEIEPSYDAVAFG